MIAVFELNKLVNYEYNDGWGKVKWMKHYD